MKMSEKFFTALQWAVERKDFEDFWPVGLESTGPAYWPQLVRDLEKAKFNSGVLSPPDYPTANVALAFCLIYGMRELDWSPLQCASLVEDIFVVAKSIKCGDLFNSDGKNLLWDSELAINKFESGTHLLKQGVTLQAVHELSGLILALAESEYFMNHRIATEKHGSYMLPDGGLLVVRSFKNLRPLELWPELNATSLTNKEFHLMYKYRVHDVKFDILSNQISTAPSNESLLDMVIVGDEWNDIVWGVSELEDFTKSIRQGISIIGESLSKMEKKQKSEQMTKILYFGCRNSFKKWQELAEHAIEIGRIRRIKHPIPKQGNDRLRYYNLTQSFAK